jgi:hypothetical protein
MTTSKDFNQFEFNIAMGNLDEAISRVLCLSTLDLSAFNVRTLRHHAEDMIGAGGKVIEHLERKLRLTVDNPVAVNPLATKKAV